MVAGKAARLRSRETIRRHLLSVPARRFDPNLQWFRPAPRREGIARNLSGAHQRDIGIETRRSQGMIRRDDEILDTADARVVDLLCRMLGGGDETLRQTLSALCVACEEGSLCLPLEPAQGLTLPVAIVGTASDAKPLILHQDRLYFHRHFHAEKSIAEGLKRLLNLGSVPCDSKKFEAVLHEILTATPLRNADSQA